MATFPSMAKAEIDGGVPPFLNAQMSRGATLKKVISYKAEGPLLRHLQPFKILISRKGASLILARLPFPTMA